MASGSTTGQMKAYVGKPGIGISLATAVALVAAIVGAAVVAGGIQEKAEHNEERIRTLEAAQGILTQIRIDQERLRLQQSHDKQDTDQKLEVQDEKLDRLLRAVEGGRL